MKTLTPFVTVVIISLFLLACFGNREVNQKLDELENELAKPVGIVQRADSIFHVLDSMNNAGLTLPKAQQMRLELVRAEAQNKADILFTTDSAVKRIVNYYDRKALPEYQYRAYYMLGCACRDMGETPQAIEWFLRATEVIDQKNVDVDYRIISGIYSQLAEQYHQQLLLDEEISCRERSIQYSLLAHDSIFAAFDLCKTGSVCIIQNNEEKAESLLIKGKEIYTKIGLKRDWIALSTTLMHLYLYQPGREHEAKRLIDEFEEEYNIRKDLTGLSRGKRQFCYYKGLYYEKTGKLDSAEFCYRKMPGMPTKYTEMDPQYQGLLHVYQKKNIPDSIAKYAKLYCEVNDSSIAITDRELTSKMTAAYRYSRFQQEASRQKQRATEARLQLMLSLASAAILTLCLGTAVLYLRHRRKEKQKELEQLAHEYSHTKKDYEERLRTANKLKETHKQVNALFQSELENNKTETDRQRALYEIARQEIEKINQQYDEMITEHHAEIEKLQQKMNDLSKHGGVTTIVERKAGFMETDIVLKFLNFIESPLNEINDSDWEQLIQAYCQHYPELIHDLQQSKLISKQALRACLLIPLRLRSSDIANILQIPIQRVSNLKQEINTSLFGDRSAKTLFNNLEQRYSIFGGI